MYFRKQSKGQLQKSWKRRAPETSEELCLKEAGEEWGSARGLGCLPSERSCVEILLLLWMRQDGIRHNGSAHFKEIFSDKTHEGCVLVWIRMPQPHLSRLLGLNSWSLVGRMVWKELGGVVLLEEVHDRGPFLKFQEFMAFLVRAFSVSVSYLWIKT